MKLATLMPRLQPTAWLESFGRSIVAWFKRIAGAGTRPSAPPPKPELLPATVAWLRNIRAEATAPRALVVVVKGPRGSVAIFPEDIAGKSDHELLAFVVERLAE